MTIPDLAFGEGVDVVDCGMIQCAALLFPKTRGLPKKEVNVSQVARFPAWGNLRDQ